VTRIYEQNTGHTQKNGAVSKVNSFETAPFFCVCPVYDSLKDTWADLKVVPRRTRDAAC
jgi:hypothetical protein